MPAAHARWYCWHPSKPMLSMRGALRCARRIVRDGAHDAAHVLAIPLTAHMRRCPVPPLTHPPCLSCDDRTLELARALDANVAAMAFNLSDEGLDEQIERLRSRFKVLQLRARNIMPLPDAAQLSARATVRRRDSGASAATGAAADAAADADAPVSVFYIPLHFTRILLTV